MNPLIPSIACKIKTLKLRIIMKESIPTSFKFRSKTIIFAAAGRGAFPSETDWKAHDKKMSPFSRNVKGVLNFWFFCFKTKEQKISNNHPII